MLRLNKILILFLQKLVPIRLVPLS
ncbi:UNVERIFIED_CONTAM: hypothetical protein GTU68_016383 [Idotea baltica]|nr:hypothetical protein [Idotea baltica]